MNTSPEAPTKRVMPIQAGRRKLVSANLLSLMIFWAGVGLEPSPASAQDKNADSQAAAIEKKMASITLPSIALQDTSLKVAIDLLESKSIELDTIEPDAKKKGIHFIFPPEESANAADTKITLTLNNVPFTEALRYVTSLAQWEFEVKADGVHLSPMSNDGAPPKPSADASAGPNRDRSTGASSKVFDKSGKQVPGLEFIARRQQNYVLEFAGRPDANTFQVTRHPSVKYRRETFLVEKGHESSDGMFRIDDYQELTAIKQGIEVDASALSITYLPDGSTHKLVRRVKLTIPTYFAEFGIEGKSSIYVKKGDTFSLPGTPDVNHQLIDVTEKKALVELAPE